MSRDLLPLFPLPVVLFPGSTVPLHVFEPRYRQLLADALASDRRFGLIRLPENIDERDLPVGTVGCVAEVVSVEALPDGRSDIVVRGTDRFTFLGLSPAAGAPYHVGWAEPLVDTPIAEGDATQLAALMERVRSSFGTAARAARQLVDDPEPVPPVTSDPAQVAFAIASMIDLDPDTRQALLACRSAAERLRQLERVLVPAARTLTGRAEVHERAKSNGHGSHPAP